MRKSPLNYIASFGIVLVGWAIGVVWGASYLGDNVSFQSIAPPEFQWAYRLVLSALAVQAMGMLAWWIAAGSGTRASMEAARARKRWTTIFVLEFVLSLAGVLAIVLLYLGELFEPLHYVAMFTTTALVTWIAFWVSTLLCSPPQVEFIPWGKR